MNQPTSRSLHLRRRQRGNDASMPVTDHLRELRNRVFKCIAAVAISSVGVFFLYDPIYRFLTHPYCEAIRAAKRDDCRLQFLDLVTPFATELRVSFYVGILVALPVIFWQVWRFVAPGLYRNEKRYALGFVGSAMFLFLLGATLAYVSLPAIFSWLLAQAGDAQVQSTVDKYLSLLTLMVVAFGVSFEFPLVLLVLQLVGLVQPDALARHRRHAIVLIFLAVAIVTPGGDPVSLFILSIPLCVFYETTIWIARALLRRRSTR
ncbi:MAG: twin-arginine translocase subunit TatC [Microthrixaceae bacterium]